MKYNETFEIFPIKYFRNSMDWIVQIADSVVLKNSLNLLHFYDNIILSYKFDFFNTFRQFLFKKIGNKS